MESQSLHDKYFSKKEACQSLTLGEFLFEEICALKKWKAKKLEGAQRRSADYLVNTEQGGFIVECKDIDNEEVIEGKCYSLVPGQEVRKRIEDARIQVKNTIEQFKLPTLLVVYDQTHLGHTMPENVRIAMYGDLKFDLKEKALFHQDNQSFQKNKNTSFSAIGALYTFNMHTPSLEVHRNFYAKIPFVRGFFNGEFVSEINYDVTH